MGAGRELDKLIAAKVFGYTEANPPIGYCRCDNTDTCAKCAWPGYAAYSTDIAAAWEVVEKIKFAQPNWQSLGLTPDHLQRFTIEYTGFGWRAGWAPINLDGNMTIEAEAETAPLAICLAALQLAHPPVSPTA